MTVWVVFAEADDARRMADDAVYHSAADAKRHAAELRKMGCEPRIKTFESEAAFHAKQVKVRGY